MRRLLPTKSGFGRVGLALIALALVVAPSAALASPGCAAVNAGALNGTATFAGTGNPTDTGTVESLNVTAFTSDRATTLAFNTGDRVDFNVAPSSGLYAYFRYNTPSANYNPSFQNTVGGAYSQTLPSGVTKAYIFSGRTSTATNGTVVASATCAPVLPAVSGLNAASGPAAGGTSVVVTGTSFTGATAVRFGATNASSFTVNSDTQITAVAPAGSGTVDVTVVNATGASATAGSGNDYVYVQAGLAIDTPTHGSTVNSTSPTITGSGSPGATVHVELDVGLGSGFQEYGTATASGGGAWTFLAAGLPAGSISLRVREEISGVYSAYTATRTFTVAATAPGWTAETGLYSGVAGGAQIIVDGTNLSGASVTVNAAAATVTANTATQVTFLTPPNPVGAYNVVITAATGTVTIEAGAQYVDGISISTAFNTSSIAVGGSARLTFTLTRPNFSRQQLAFSATLPAGLQVAATPNAANAGGCTSVAFAPVAGAGVVALTNGRMNVASCTFSVDVTATTAGAKTVTPGPVSATVGGALIAGETPTGATLSVNGSGPTVTALSPATGPLAGGTSVTVTGADLTGATAVSFGSTAATGFTVNSATQITATSPAGTGAVNVTVTTPGGTSAAGLTFTYVDRPLASGRSGVAVAFDSAGTAIDLSASITGGPHASIAIGTAPAHGTTSVAGDVITYTPTAGYFGADSFTYTATGPGGTSAPSTVSLTVATPPTPTVAARSGVSVSYNSTGAAIDLSGSVTGVHTSLAVASTPAHGATSVFGDVITYTPANGYFGVDSFTFTATGPGGTSAPATVSLLVATPPPPIVTPPPPVTAPPPPQTGGTGEVTVNLGAQTTGVIDGFRVTVAARHGTATVEAGATASAASAGLSKAAPLSIPSAQYSLVYVPASGFMGTDTVTVVAFGPGGDSVPATFTFQIPGKAPDLSGQTASSGSVTFTPTAGLTGGPFQALRIIRAPDFGTAVVQGLSIVFTPGVANGGATSLEYVIDLPFGSSASGQISLTSNLVPVAQALTASTVQGRPVTVRISDVQGGPFTSAAVISISPSTAGTATIARAGTAWDLTLTPTGAFSGQAVVTYTLTNAFGTATSTVAVTVEARPDPSLDPDVRGVARGQVTTARRFADAQIGNVQRRLQDLHDGDNSSSNGLSLNLGFGGQADADNDPRVALRRQLGQGRMDDPGELGDDRSREMLGLDVWAGRQAVPDAVDPRRGHMAPASGRANDAPRPAVGVWSAGAVDWGRQDAHGRRDDRFTTQGVTAGLDLRVSDQLIVGGGLGYGEDKTRIGDEGTTTTGEGITGALYASWRPAEAMYLDGMLGYADMDFTSRRWTQGLAGQPDGYATGERSGDVRFASAAFGRIARSPTRSSDLYARLDAREIKLDGFVETGAGLASLVWDAVEQKSLSASLGASWRWTMDAPGRGLFTPSLRVEWSHELENLDDQGVRYADWAASPTYLAPLDAWSRDSLRLDLGADWALTGRLMLSLGYRGMIGDSSESHGAEVRIKFGW